MFFEKGKKFRVKKADKGLRFQGGISDNRDLAASIADGDVLTFHSFGGVEGQLFVILNFEFKGFLIDTCVINKQEIFERYFDAVN